MLAENARRASHCRPKALVDALEECLESRLTSIALLAWWQHGEAFGT
ncbi:hypothetical protein [uncultured Piscinibacter sp.]|nr:hypothetical protein [uncultured Piscinibacter sp.]